jgi:hypothetical protein
VTDFVISYPCKGCGAEVVDSPETETSIEQPDGKMKKIVGWLRCTECGTVHGFNRGRDLRERSASGRPIWEAKAGDHYYRAAAEWRKRQQIWDRRANLYTEVITGLDGTVIEEKREPLSEHTNHGSAKRRRSEGSGDSG